MTSLVLTPARIHTFLSPARVSASLVEDAKKVALAARRLCFYILKHQTINIAFLFVFLQTECLWGSRLTSRETLGRVREVHQGA